MTQAAPAGAAGRTLHLVLGVLFVGVGALGVALPILPTTPFLLLASWSFARSSPRLQAWLRRSPLFGPWIADWERERGVRRSVKVWAILAVALAVSLSLTYGELCDWARALLVALALVGVWVVLSLHTIDDKPS